MKFYKPNTRTANYVCLFTAPFSVFVLIEAKSWSEFKYMLGEGVFYLGIIWLLLFVISFFEDTHK